MAYQCVLVAMLQRSLKRLQLGPEKIAQAINRFMFELGEFHDHGWLKAKGNRIYPLLCFTREFLNTTTDVSTIGTINAPSTFFAFHEHALGIVEQCLEGNEDTKIETGFFDDAPNA